MNEGACDGCNSPSDGLEDLRKEEARCIGVGERIVQHVALGVERLRVGHILHQRIGRARMRVGIRSATRRNVRSSDRRRGYSCERDRRYRAVRGSVWAPCSGSRDLVCLKTTDYFHSCFVTGTESCEILSSCPQGNIVGSTLKIYMQILRVAVFPPTHRTNFESSWWGLAQCKIAATRARKPIFRHWVVPTLRLKPDNREILHDETPLPLPIEA